MKQKELQDYLMPNPAKKPNYVNNKSLKIYFSFHQPKVPGSPLNGPTISLVIQPP